MNEKSLKSITIEQFLFVLNYNYSFNKLIFYIFKINLYF